MADLTTLAAVKAYGPIAGTELDTLIGALIGRASAAIENFLQAHVLVDDYVDVRNGTGGATMLLRERPVVSVSSVTVDGQSIPAAAAFGEPGWWLEDRMVLLTGYSYTSGTANVRIAYRAGYDTTPADIEQACIETVMLALRRREHIDVSSKSLAGETVSYLTAELTPSARQVLQSYRRVAPL